jgi:hypothetical protein
MGCHHCSDQYVDPDEAYQFFMSKSFQPLIPYPGSNKPWKSIHLICGSEAQPSYGKIKSGRTGCRVCSGMEIITQKKAVAFYRSTILGNQFILNAEEMFHHVGQMFNREAVFVNIALVKKLI